MAFYLRFGWIFLGLALFVHAPSPARAFSVNSIDFKQQDGFTDLTITLSEAVEFRSFVLPDPYRIIVDLPKFEWRATTINRPRDFVISDIRQGPLQAEVSRIVFDVRGPVRIEEAKITGAGLRIRFERIASARFAMHKDDVFGALRVDHNLSPEMKDVLSNLNPQDGFLKPASLLTAPPKAPPPKPPVPQATETPPTRLSDQERPLVIIDPGHGGIDPGAIGPNGKKEKDIVLALGKDLRDILIASGRYKVELTRESDVFIPLRDRVQFARNREADLFISLHADSIHRPEVRGSSVYTLSREASDAQTAKLAEKENNADLIGGIDLSIEDEQVAFILGDFLMTETLNQSKFFANTLVERMKKHGVSVLENTHRYAGFAVLKAPDIPSVLVEAGFMSNKKEAKLLSQQEHRQKISRALKAGIDAYFDHLAKTTSE